MIYRFAAPVWYSGPPWFYPIGLSDGACWLRVCGGGPRVECDDSASDTATEGGPVLADPVTGISDSGETPRLPTVGVSKGTTVRTFKFLTTEFS